MALATYRTRMENKAGTRVCVRTMSTQEQSSLGTCQNRILLQRGRRGIDRIDRSVRSCQLLLLLDVPMELVEREREKQRERGTGGGGECDYNIE